MNSPIKTNQLEVVLNRNALAEQYDIFKVSITKQWFDRGSYILDAPQLCNEVRAVFFERGNTFYTLMRKNISNRSRLLEVLRKEKDVDTISLESVNPHSIHERIVVSLLLRDMGSYQNESLRFSNLTGRLYCSCPDWKSSKNQVHALELSVDQDMRLVMDVRTFTSELERKNITCRKVPFNAYARYIFGAGNILRRRLKHEKQPGYILRQIDNKRHNVEFLNISNKASFEKSKMGILQNAIRRFNNRYQGICNLSFRSITEYSSIEDKSADRRKKTEIKAITDMLKNRPIKIVDQIGNEYSSVFCESVQVAIKKLYDSDVSIGKRLSKNHLNICLIHNESYYENENDPHKTSHDGFVIQHITIEDFKKDSEASLRTTMKNLLIKDDIRNRCLSMFDWRSAGFEETVRFGMCKRELNSERYFFLDIQPDGSFSFCEKPMNPSLNDSYTTCINAMAGEKQKDVNGIVQYADGCINIIRESSLFTIPELDLIEAELSS